MIEMLSPEMKEQYKKFFAALPVKGRLLETGTGYGHSAKFFSELKPEWNIYSVDGFGLYGDGRIYSAWNDCLIKQVNSNLPKNVIQILADSSRVNWELPLNVLYIDADHTYKGAGADYNCYASFVKKDGLIIFDDYEKHNSINEVARFVDELNLEILYKGRAAILKK